MRRSALVLVTVLPALVAGCSQDDPVGPGPTHVVHRADFGAKWPLTVDSGTLRCQGEADYGAVTLQTDGKVYALNVPASSQKLGRPVNEIWADDPEAPGSKKEIGLLVAEGLELCERSGVSPSGSASAS